MQTSLARRQARRLNGGHRHRGGGAARRAAIALPLFLFGALAFVALFGFVFTVGTYAYFSQDLDDPRGLDRIEFNQESVIYDRTGRIELARFGSENRQVVAYKDIPDFVLDATTAVEDKTFWTNTGFDPAGIVAAGVDTISGASRGGSTITQQLVRQRLLNEELVQDPERRMERKIKEIIQSVRLTQAFPGDEGKRQIITAYLNQNFYGNNSYGIKAAAERYFGVENLADLTLGQAALLAAIPQSPTNYDLVRNAVERKGQLVVPNRSKVVQRRNFILDLMADGRTPLSGTKLDAADFAAAKKERVVLVDQEPPRWKAPHFVWAVRNELTRKLCDRGAATCPRIERGGLRVRTTLDWPIQKIAERWVKAAAIAPHRDNPEKMARSLKIAYEPWMENLRNKDLNNGALVALDYQTGEVLAYVGSADYYSGRATRKFQPQFDVLADGWRQPGSAFKPFNYGTGIQDRTITAATMFMDVVTDFGNDYTPTDADNLERGPVRARSALQFSLNIPAIKAIAYTGVDRVFDVAKKAGMKFQKKRADAGYALTLGTTEVHPVDLVTAYGTLANNGRFIGHTHILEVKSAAGKNAVKLYQPPEPQQVLSRDAAYIVTDMLNGNTNPAINPYWGAFRIEDGQGRRRDATLKTGTNNDAKDLNAYGFLAAPNQRGRERGEYALAVGAWNGNSDNSVVSTAEEPLFSIDVTTHVWQGFIEEATADWELRAFQKPDTIAVAAVDAFTGLRPGPSTTQTVNELFLEGTGPRDGEYRVGIQVDAATNLLWREGCEGPPVTKAFLDLSQAEKVFPRWQEANQAWIARARQGPGVVGGPEDTKTSYFYNGSFQPYGASWGAAFPPGQTCPLKPKATPTPTPTKTPRNSPSGRSEEPTKTPRNGRTPKPSAEPTKTPKPEPTRTPRATKTPRPQPSQSSGP
ncbi:MAG: transglycosylase domain-containing protein [Chloroflexi bacterium]|nr:transglycosylase domain-containing protein [Chloroflexota bacterium]